MADDTSSPNQQTIEVDDAAAYFGATTSSDMLHTLMSMPREQAMIQFFDILSDIVLSPGDFDFEAASERMQCEGGEIYYLVAGHLGLMSLPDPLLDALGLPNSSGDTLGARHASISPEQEGPLTQLADPMRMMKIFAVAHQTGKGDELMKYMNTLQGHLNTIEQSVEVLVNINKELDAALDVSGHILPLPSLASGTAEPAELTLPATPPPVASTPKTVVPLPSMESPSVPVPTTTVSEPSPAPTTVPLPSESVQLPVIEAETVPEETVVNVESEKQVARATQNAFAGAFDIGIGTEEQPPPVAEPQAQETIPSAVPLLQEDPSQEEPEEEEFVSAAEHFIAADEDSSGALSVEELALATGATIEEASELHAEADTDGDGVVTLSEFISSPAGERSAALPKPVAPVRKPLGAGQQQAPQAPQPVTQRPPPLPQQPQQPQQNWQQQPQPGWPQPQAPMVQPTIRSGVHCRNCGIGLDPYWRFCPVCGQQNMGY